MKTDFQENANIISDEHPLVIPPNNILKGAEHQLERVVLVGVDLQGYIYVSASHNINEAIDMLERGLDELKKRKAKNK